ncbi:MAG TPA: hypothetical protein PLO67_20065 [Saprospiraceae bacterium]|nr:hypothetical protein [Saprospiraceae bacterium]HPI07418.1 hypothetical protein [Saprospiraceae bacterium]
MKQTLFFVAILALISYSCQKESFSQYELTGSTSVLAASERGDSTFIHPCDSLGHHHLDSLGHHHVDSLGHDSIGGHHNHPIFPDSLIHHHLDSLHVPHDTIPGGPHGGGGHHGGGHGGHGGGH